MVVLLAAFALASDGFQTLDGKRHSFANPDPTVLLFVMADCPIVRGYAPELRRIGQSARTDLFLVHVDPTTDAEGSKSFAKEYRLPFPSVLDPQHDLVRKFGIEAVPTAVVLDRRGRAAYVGRIDDRFPSLGVQRPPRTHDLRDALEALREGRSIPRRTKVVGCAVPDL